MIIRICVLLVITIFLLNCANEGRKQSLFNGKDLSGWDKYIGPGYDTVSKKRDAIPLGLNNDPKNVFSVVNEDGQPAIRISGEQFGGISTTDEFQNFHLSVEFKWGSQKWVPREDKKRDSGVLYHAVGPHGADGGFWMRSQEFQVQEDDCGDYWGVAGGAFDIPVAKVDTGFVYNARGEMLTFSRSSPNGRRCIKNPDAEKPTGEWNVIDIYCFGDTSVHVINGKVNMILYRSRQVGEDGQESSLKKGKIQIQSEGAEVFYRNIQLQSIDKLPEALVQKN